MDHVTQAMPFSGGSVVRRLTIDIACKHTKFDDVPQPFHRYFKGCEII